MSSWLQWGSLSDQISSFAKDVLAEAEEEVQDPVAELKVAKSKLEEQQNTLETVKSEFERMKQHNEELSDRAETSEYQIAAISKEYRNLVQQKENEIKNLKSENLKLEEKLDVFQSQQSLQVREEGKIPKTTSSALLMAEEGLVEVDMNEGFDGPSWSPRVDPFGSHVQDVKRLQDEVAYLKEEVQKWRKIAEGEVQSSERKEVEVLQLKLKKLSEKCASENVQHQSEITSLKTSYEEKVKLIQSTADKKEVLYQSQIKELENQLSQSPPTENHQSEKGTADLSTSSDLLRAEVEKMVLEIGILEDKIQEERSSKEQLEVAQSALQQETQDLQQYTDRLSKELRERETEILALKVKLEDTKQQFQEFPEQVSVLRLSNTKLTEENESLKEVKESLKEESESLKEENESLKATIEASQSRIANLEAKNQLTNKGILRLQSQVSHMKALHYEACNEIRSGIVDLQTESKKMEDSILVKAHQLQTELSQTLRTLGDTKSEMEMMQSEKNNSDDVETVRRDLSRQLEAERKARERLQEHLTQVTSDHDAELGELLQERQQLQESLRSVEEQQLLNASQQHREPEEADGWDNWGSTDVQVPSQESEKLASKMAEIQKALEEQIDKGQQYQKWIEEKERILSDIAKLLNVTPDTNLLSAIECALRDKETTLQQLREVESASHDKVEEQQRRLEQLQSTIQATEKTLTDLESKCHQKDLEMETLQKHLEEANQVVSNREDILLDLQNSVAKTMELSALLALREKELADLSEGKDIYDQAQVELTELKSSQEEMKTLLLQIETENGSLKSQNEELMQACAQLSGQEEKQNQKILILQQRLESVQNELTKAQEMLQFREKEIEELDARLKTKEAEVISLSSERSLGEESLRESLKDREGLTQKMEQTILQLEQELVQVKQSAASIQSSLETQLNQLKGKMESYEKKLPLKNEEVHRLQEQLTALSREKVKMSDLHQAALDKVSLEKKTAEHKLEELQQQMLALQKQKDVLLSELNAKCAALEGERSEIIKTLDGIGVENSQLKEELALLRNQGDSIRSKHTEELERLKKHLVQVDEHYTQEALKAEEREVELRQRINQLQADLHNTSQAEDTVSHHQKQKLFDLQQQLHVMAQQRDDAVMKLANTQEDLEQTNHELSNLQMVLEQFQKDHTSEVNLALKDAKSELVSTQLEKVELHQQISKLQEELQEASFSLGNASLLTSQLEERNREYHSLQKKSESLQASLNTSQLKIEQLLSQDNEKVDKNLVKNLLHGYLTASDKKKGEVIKLIANILGFSEEEVKQTYGSRSWLSSWFGKSPKSPASKETSFMEMFVDFLEKESGRSKSSDSNLRSPGYVDPHLDPDKPSLATSFKPSHVAAVNPRPPGEGDQLTSPVTPPSATGSTLLALTGSKTETGSGGNPGLIQAKDGSLMVTSAPATSLKSSHLVPTLITQPQPPSTSTGGATSSGALPLSLSVSPIKPISNTSLQSTLLKDILTN